MIAVILVNELMDLLKDFSTDWNDGNIDTKERNVEIDALIDHVKNLEINFTQQPLNKLPNDIKYVFNNHLKRYKLRIALALTSLKEVNNRKSYNAKVRYLLNKQLYFKSLFNLLQRSIAGYDNRNKLYFSNNSIQIFILGSENNE